MKKITAALMALSLAACGGGDGGSTSDATPDSKLISIDLTNADSVSSYMALAAFLPSDLTLLLQSTSLDLTRSTTESKLLTAPSIGTIFGFAHNVLTSSPSSSNLTRAFSETLQCDSGSITYTYELGADDIPNAVGEYAQIVFNQCIYNYDYDSDGITDYSEAFDGQLKTELSSWVSEAQYAVNISADLDISYDGEQESIGGTLTIAIANYGENIQITSDKLTYSFSADNITIENVDITGTTTSTNTSVNMSGNVSSTALGGSFGITTESALIYDPFYYYPVQGIIKASGAGGSYVSLNADTNDPTTVTQTVFDGNSSTAKDIGWDDLENYLPSASTSI